jgi:hypothetical protein
VIAEDYRLDYNHQGSHSLSRIKHWQPSRRRVASAAALRLVALTTAPKEKTVNPDTLITPGTENEGRNGRLEPCKLIPAENISKLLGWPVGRKVFVAGEPRAI